MQRVLVALMLGAAAAFQRTPVVRSRVLAVFIQLHSPGRSSSRGDAGELPSARRASPNSSRALLRALLPPRGCKRTNLAVDASSDETRRALLPPRG